MSSYPPGYKRKLIVSAIAGYALWQLVQYAITGTYVLDHPGGYAAPGQVVVPGSLAASLVKEHPSTRGGQAVGNPFAAVASLLPDQAPAQPRAQVGGFVNMMDQVGPQTAPAQPQAQRIIPVASTGDVKLYRIGQNCVACVDYDNGAGECSPVAPSMCGRS